MKLEFLGAMGSVGASGISIEDGSNKIVLDYGTKVREVPPKFPLPVERPKAILLSHSHLDHCGAVPLLVKKYSTPIYALDVTKDLTELLLEDSIKVSREEGVELPFNDFDVKQTIKNFVLVDYNKPFKIGNFQITYFDAGHIPGSAMIFVESKETNVLYTGDFNDINTRLLEKCEDDLPKVKNLIIESTYGCVPGDVDIMLSTNQTKEIKELTKGVLVKAMDRKFQLRDFEISKVWRRNYSGKMFKITTESNKKLILTPNHPLFVKSGKNILVKPVSEVRIGDKVPVIVIKNEKNCIPSPLHIYELKPEKSIYVKLKPSFLQEVLQAISKNKDELAKLLGISKNTLKDYLKIKPYKNKKTGKRKFYFMPLFIAKKVAQLAGKSLDLMEENIEGLKSKNSSIIIKNVFPLKKSPILAKLLAKSFGDGHIRLNSGMYFEYANICKELTTEVDKIIKELFDISYSSYGKNRKIIKHYYPFIGAVLYTLGCPQDKVDETMKIPEWIKNGPKEIKVAFLQGLFDDEAHVSYYKTENRVLGRILLKMAKSKKLKSNLIEFFAELKQMLLDLDINARIDLGPEYKDRIELLLIIQGRKNIENFKNYVGFIHPSKRELLERILTEKWKEKENRKNIVFEKILDIEIFTTNDIEVYDLTIGELKEWGNFVANGIIIHNSREHPDRKREEKELVKMIEETISDNHPAIVAAFAVGRAQEILLILAKHGISYPLFMDGMAKKATTIINRYKKYLREPEDLEEALKLVTYVKGRMRRRLVKEAACIITTSGMLTGGPVVKYIEKLYKKERASLILTGWQIEGTPGRILLETGRFIYGNVDIEVKMKVKRFDFSAHAGRKSLFEFVKKLNPEKVFCVHGDHTEEFAEELRKEGFNAIAPLANSRIFECQ
jgi:Cft2 family RNA processing exonuclease